MTESPQTDNAGAIYEATFCSAMQPDQTPLLPAANNWEHQLREALHAEAGGREFIFTKLADGSGALVVMPMNQPARSNARIVDSNGKIRCTIEIPPEYATGVGFYDAYYVGSELTAVFIMNNRDVAFVIDEQTGQVVRSYETK